MFNEVFMAKKKNTDIVYSIQLLLFFFDVLTFAIFTPQCEECPQSNFEGRGKTERDNQGIRKIVRML